MSTLEQRIGALQEAAEIAHNTECHTEVSSIETLARCIQVVANVLRDELKDRAQAAPSVSPAEKSDGT